MTFLPHSMAIFCISCNCLSHNCDYFHNCENVTLFFTIMTLFLSIVALYVTITSDFFCNCNFIFHNCDFTSHNSDFVSYSCKLISYYDFISYTYNCDCLSPNMTVYYMNKTFLKSENKLHCI